MLLGLLLCVTLPPLSLLCQHLHEVIILCLHARHYPFDCRFQLLIFLVATVIHELVYVNLCHSRLFFFSGYDLQDKFHELIVCGLSPSLSILAVEQEDALIGNSGHS